MATATSQYRMLKALHFTARQYYAHVGDVLMVTPPKATVYRNGKLMTSFDLGRAAIDALLKTGGMTQVQADPAQAPVAESPALVVVPVEEEAPLDLTPQTPEVAVPVEVTVPADVPTQVAEIVVPVEVATPTVNPEAEAAAAAQILAAELGPDDDGSVPEGEDAPLDPAAAPATPKLSRRDKAKAAAAASLEVTV
jgi:hypothetical protein